MESATDLAVVICGGKGHGEQILVVDTSLGSNKWDSGLSGDENGDDEDDDG